MRDEHDEIFISIVEIFLRSILGREREREREKERGSRGSKYTRGNLLAFNEG